MSSTLLSPPPAALPNGTLLLPQHLIILFDAIAIGKLHIIIIIIITVVDIIILILLANVPSSN